MKLKDVVEILGARVSYGGKTLLSQEVKTVAASDLMSDLLTRTRTPDILLTRLNNTQIIHTSSIFGIKAVVIVRDRPVAPNVIERAEEEGVVLLGSPCGLFESCGKLYERGLRGIS